MIDVVCSVPHSGTRTLVEHLGLSGNSPRGQWLHFDYDDALLKGNPGLHLHIPLRDPMEVAASWGRRGKNMDRLRAAYTSMFKHLDRPHTIYRVEDLPVLAGHLDSDRVLNPARVSGYRAVILAEFVEPNAKFFEQYY